MSVQTLPPASASVRTARVGTRPRRTGQTGTPDPVRTYAESVVAGRVVAGTLARQACQRHLDDLKHGRARGLVWRPEEAQRVMDLISRMRLPTGEPFILQPVQQFIVGSIFGWQLVGGARRFRTAYVEMGKGNGKTPLAAAIGLVCLLADGRQAAEVYCAGVTRDQAHYLWRDAKRMVEASDTMKQHIEVGAQRLVMASTDSYMASVSSEARTLDQKRVHAAVIDEIHEHRTNEVVEKLRAGTKGDETALILEITNSGYDRNSICWQHHQYSRQVLSGTIPNDSWFGFIAALDEGDDWTDEAVWPKANPLLDIAVTRRYLREQVQEALDMPPKAALVQRLNFCIWTEASVGAIDMTRWDACGAQPTIPSGAPVYLGLDLASRLDLTALAILHEDPAGCIHVLARFWCPEEGIATRSRRDHVPYELWVRQGWITATKGNTTDQERVRDDIHGVAARYDVREIGYDDWNAGWIGPKLQEDRLAMVPIHQVYSQLSGPTKDWLALIASGRVRHGGNPVLRWMASNLVVEQGPQETVRPDKDRSTEKIDGQVAAIMALARLTAPHEAAARPGMLDYWVGLAAAVPDEPQSVGVAPEPVMAVPCGVLAHLGSVMGPCGELRGHTGAHAP